MHKEKRKFFCFNGGEVLKPEEIEKIIGDMRDLLRSGDHQVINGIVLNIAVYKKILKEKNEEKSLRKEIEDLERRIEFSVLKIQKKGLKTKDDCGLRVINGDLT